MSHFALSIMHLMELAISPRHKHLHFYFYLKFKVHALMREFGMRCVVDVCVFIFAIATSACIN